MLSTLLNPSYWTLEKPMFSVNSLGFLLMEELTLRALVVLIVGCLVVVCTLIIVLIIETLLVGLVVSPALALKQHIVMDDHVVMDDNSNSTSSWMIIYEKLASAGYLPKLLPK